MRVLFFIFLSYIFLLASGLAWKEVSEETKVKLDLLFDIHM